MQTKYTITVSYIIMQATQVSLAFKLQKDTQIHTMKAME